MKTLKYSRPIHSLCNFYFCTKSFSKNTKTVKDFSFDMNGSLGKSTELKILVRKGFLTFLSKQEEIFLDNHIISTKLMSSSFIIAQTTLILCIRLFHRRKITLIAVYRFLIYSFLIVYFYSSRLHYHKCHLSVFS